MQQYTKCSFIVFLCSWFIHQYITIATQWMLQAGFGKWCEKESFLENPQTPSGGGSISGLYLTNTFRD